MFTPQGIITPVVTPFCEDGSFNEPVFRRVISHLIEQGIHGIFPLGTTGEFYACDGDLARRILAAAVDEVRGRVPVYAGANHISTRGVVEFLRIAEEAKVDAVSVLTPMFVSQTQDELYQFFRSVAKSTSLPVIMYNNKPKTNVTIEPETVARLAEIENIVGVKDSTGDMTNTAEYIRLTRGNEKFHVLVGRDTLIYAGLCYGASGAIASCSNVAPRVAVDIYERFKSGDMAGALDAQFILAPLRIACNMGTFPEVIKEGLMMEGFPVGACLPPIGPLTPAQAGKLRQVLESMGLV